MLLKYGKHAQNFRGHFYCPFCFLYFTKQYYLTGKCIGRTKTKGIVILS